MPQKRDVQQGTLSLMILRSLDLLGPMHGYAVGARTEETSRGRLSLNYGTLYPALLKLEQEGFIEAEWGTSDNNRRAKFYSITRAGQKQLAREIKEWEDTRQIMSWFLRPARPTP